MPLQTYDHAYWSIPRFKGSKARIEDVFHLWIPSAKKCHKVSKHWVRCEVNEWTQEYWLVDKRDCRLENERLPLTYAFFNCSYYYKLVEQDVAADFRSRTAWIDPVTSELTGKGALNEYFPGPGEEAEPAPEEEDMLIMEPPPAASGAAAGTTRVRVEPRDAASSRSSSPLTDVASSGEDERSPTPPASTSGSRSLSITSPSLDTTRAKRKRATVSAGSTSMSFVSPAGLVIAGSRTTTPKVGWKCPRCSRLLGSNDGRYRKHVLSNCKAPWPNGPGFGVDQPANKRAQRVAKKPSTGPLRASGARQSLRSVESCPVSRLALVSTSSQPTLAANPAYDDATGDLAIVSSDGFRSRFRKNKLRGLADYFDDQLQAAPDRSLWLPLRVEETAQDVGLFLQHALGASSGQGNLTFARARRLLELTEVYHAPLVAASACASQLIQHVQTEAPTVFALAAIHNNNFVAQFALAQFGNAFSRTLVSPDEWTISGRPRSLAEIPADLFGRIPPLALRNALCLQDRALLPSDQEAEGLSNPWPELASAFSIS